MVNINNLKYIYGRHTLLRFTIVLALILLFLTNTKNNDIKGKAKYENDLFYMESEMVIPTNKSMLAIRKGPGFTYPVVISLDSCNALKVIEKGLWYRVMYNDTFGYVYSASFIDSEAYEPDRLKGYIIGIDPDGQKEINTQSEFISPKSKQLKEKMSERNVGTITGSFDYDINSKISVKLKMALEEEGATVIMTRDDSDVNMSNKERADYLNRNDCDVVLRISCESSLNPMDNGVSVYISKLSAETKSVILAKNILRDLSKQLNTAKTGVNVLNDNTFLNWLKNTAVQVEIGYLSNMTDEKKLIADNHQQEIAKALKNSIVTMLCDMNEKKAD